MGDENSATPSVLTRLLEPVLPADFFRDYWEKKTLHIRRDVGSANESILTVRDLDSFLARTDIRYPSVQMVKDGGSLALRRYSSILRFGSYASEGLIDCDRVFREFHDGSTVVCQLLQNSIPRTGDFVRQLSKELNFRVDAHAFITPQNACGLSTHYDTASAFILQISGRKRWRLFEPTLELPMSDQVFDNNAGTAFVETDDILLESGDLLYLPRGVPHCPVTIDAHSIHVTVVLFPPTWLDLLQNALVDVSRDSTFRRAPRTEDARSLTVEKDLLSKFESAATLAVASVLKRGGT